MDELIRRRMARQFLIRPGAEVCRDLCAIQAQYWRNAAHALRLRCNAPDWDTLCKTWTLRGTLHLCAVDDLPLLLALGHTGRAQDDAADGDVWLGGELCLSAARKQHWLSRIPALVTEGIVERDALRAACIAEGMTESEQRCVFDPWGGLLRALCQQGTLAYRAREKKAFRTLPPMTIADRDTAGLELTRRYFTRYGPASLRDAAAFLGVTQAELRRWAATLPLEASAWGGETLYALPCPEDGELPDCVLLAGFDPLLLGYDKRRNPILPPEHLRGIYTLQGIVHPAIVLHGRIVGRWKQTGRQLTLTLFEPVSERQRILDAAEQLWPDLKMITWE